MKYFIAIVFSAFMTISAHAKPLPDNDEWHFFAVVNCDRVVLFSWYTPEGGKVVPVGRIQNEKMVEEILTAKEKAEKDGNAYRINVGVECPRI